MQNRKKKLLVIGSTNIDHIIRLKNFPKPGETLNGRDYQIAYGGKGANQAVAAARLGANTHFISCLGGDSLGTSLLQSLTEMGICTDDIRTFDTDMTGVAMIWLADSGENSIAINAGANSRLDADYVNQIESTIASADAILIQLETPISGVKQAIQLAKKHHKLIALNPAPAQQLDDEFLSAIDIITPNETETETLTGITVSCEASAQRAAEVLHAKGIDQVFITRGRDGVYYSHNGKGKNYEGFTVTPVDTTAAGDTFNGGLLTALLEGKTTDEAIRFAQAAAALSVQALGAQSSIPTHEQVTQFLDTAI